MHVNCDLSSKQ